MIILGDTKGGFQQEIVVMFQQVVGVDGNCNPCQCCQPFREAFRRLYVSKHYEYGA